MWVTLVIRTWLLVPMKHNVTWPLLQLWCASFGGRVTNAAEKAAFPARRRVCLLFQSADSECGATSVLGRRERQVGVWLHWLRRFISPASPCLGEIIFPVRLQSFSSFVTPSYSAFVNFHATKLFWRHRTGLSAPNTKYLLLCSLPSRFLFMFSSSLCRHTNHYRLLLSTSVLPSSYLIDPWPPGSGCLIT